MVDAFVRAVDKGGGLLMNIGTGVETSVQQLFDVMAQARRIQAARRATTRPAPVRCNAARSIPSRAGIHLGWQPWTSLEEGVARTLEHFKGRSSPDAADASSTAIRSASQVPRADTAATRRAPTYAGSG